VYNIAKKTIDMKKYITLFLILLTFTNLLAQTKLLNLVVGTYTNNCESDGIYIYSFDTKTGEFVFKNASSKTINPSYLSVSSDSKFIYSVNENGDESAVSAFSFNNNNKTIKLINTQNAKGASPCYIANDGINILTANYSSGNVTVFGMNNDGSISEAIQVLQHKGKSINEKRQTSPHSHMVTFTPDQKFVLANDLGNDKIYIYDYKPRSRFEILKIKDTVNIKAGSGPRHSVFSKNGKYLYLLQELDGTITAFDYKKGNLKIKQETSVIDQNFTGEIGAADIHISPDGQFLYATNRGTANTISSFKILKNGMLKLIEHTSTLGKKPRNFTIDPTGNFLLIANQDSNDIIIFKRDLKTGKLTDTGKKIEICSPVCLLLVK
jgi:6-phosphogluconolactonase